LKYGDPAELEAKIEQDAHIMFKRNQMKIIEEFSGYYEFMSLEFSCPVWYQGHLYNSCAHAYAAAKVIFMIDKFAIDLNQMDGLLRRI
jgi:hypothetical protein